MSDRAYDVGKARALWHGVLLWRLRREDSSWTTSGASWIWNDRKAVSSQSRMSEPSETDPRELACRSTASLVSCHAAIYLSIDAFSHYRMINQGLE